MEDFSGSTQRKYALECLLDVVQGTVKGRKYCPAEWNMPARATFDVNTRGTSYCPCIVASASMVPGQIVDTEQCC